jgi:hypothetical protein
VEVVLLAIATRPKLQPSKKVTPVRNSSGKAGISVTFSVWLVMQDEPVAAYHARLRLGFEIGGSSLGSGRIGVAIRPCGGDCR